MSRGLLQRLAPVALLLVAALACRPAEVRHARAAQPPNLILVSYDSLRADHLGAYGYARDTSPNLDRFASESVVFERAYSTSSWTLPAHASMLTSLYPEEHGARDVERALGAGAVLLPEVLAAAGYRSGAVVSVGLLHRVFGFAQGWELYDDETATENGADPERRRTSDVVARRATELIDALAPGPFFLFVHDYDVHFDYQPPPPYDSMFDPASMPGFDSSGFISNDAIHRGMPRRRLKRLIALYDGEIRWIDRNLGHLLGELERRGIADRTVVAVTADHGEEFFEHGAKGHRTNLFNTSLQVPLIVRFPDRSFAGRRVGTPVSLVDLPPTLAAAAGVPPDSSWSGIDLHSLLAAEETPDPPRWLFAELMTRDGAMKRAAISGSLKGLARFSRGGRQIGSRALYDLERDPHEKRSLHASPAGAQRMSAFVERMTRAAALFGRKNVELGSGWVELDDERVAELRALGYL